MEYAGALGLDMIQGDHEDAPGQLELNFNFDRAEITADNLTTYRQICKQVGREMNAFPCFMPKPFMGVSANGCHHNISIWKGDQNLFDPPDPSNPMMPGDMYKVFRHYKWDEWERYCATVTDWDVEEYLDILP